MYLPWCLRLTLVLFLNSIYFEFVMQQYNLDLLFIILLISSEQVSFGKMVCKKQSSPCSTTRACLSGFPVSHYALTTHELYACIGAFAQWRTACPHLFHTTLMVMLWMSPRTFWPIAFSRSSSSLWLNDLSYLFDHAFEPISFLSFFNLDVVHNVRNRWKIVLHFFE
jgi:hypothetical protein